MKKKNFKNWCYFLALVWGLYTLIYTYFNFNQESLGTVATLAGIALMFAISAWQVDLKD